MQLTTQVMARNTKPQVVVLSSDAKGSDYVEWQAAGDPSGGDVQIIPDTLAQSVQFIKLVQRGVMVVDNADQNPEVSIAIERQRAAFEQRTKSASEKAQATIEHTAQNDMLSLPCVGPDSRGQGKCGVEVPTREKTKDEKPPLCSQHAPLAPQYVPMDEQEGTAVVKRWVRVTMGSPERQQQ